MPRRLTAARAAQVEKAIELAHRLIHRVYEDQRITAVSLAEMAQALAEASEDLRSLSTSPFLAIEPQHRPRLTEPEALTA